MSIQKAGFAGVINETDATWRADRVSLRPIDYGSQGAYSVSMLSGTIAAGQAANSQFLQARWTDVTRNALITDIIIDGLSILTAFTAGAGKIDAIVGRNYTANGTGGNAATLSTNNNKLRTAMGSASLMTDFRREHLSFAVSNYTQR